MCVCVCMRACVHVFMCGRVYVCACVRACERARVFVCVCVAEWSCTELSCTEWSFLLSIATLS